MNYLGRTWESLYSVTTFFLDFTILPMKNDINNMQGHISDILAAQGSLSGNLSHAQNDLHDLYGMTGIVLQLMKNSRVFFFDKIWKIFFLLLKTTERWTHSTIYMVCMIFSISKISIFPLLLETNQCTALGLSLDGSPIRAINTFWKFSQRIS